MGLFGSDKARNVALIDVSSSSVRAAYARIAPGAPVAIYYATRVPMEVKDVSVSASAPIMLRTLDTALRDLREHGAPILHRRTKSGSVATVFVTLGGPWQDASIRVETAGDGKPFTFTADFLEKARSKGEVASGRFRSEATVVATLLNGYETKEPVGKRAKSAEIIVLSASIATEVAELMRKALGSFSAHHDVRFSTFASLIFESVGVLFPVEKDYLGLRVSGEATELLFVKHGLPLASVTLACGLNEFARAAKKSGVEAFPISDAVDEKAVPDLGDAQGKWVTAITEALKTFTATHALPRTLFLVTDPEARAFMHKALDVPEVHALWLSDEPLSVLTLEPKHFASHIGGEAGTTEELPLDMLALVARERLAQS